MVVTGSNTPNRNRAFTNVLGDTAYGIDANVTYVGSRSLFSLCQIEVSMRISKLLYCGDQRHTSLTERATNNDDRGPFTSLLRLHNIMVIK